VASQWHRTTGFCVSLIALILVVSGSALAQTSAASQARAEGESGALPGLASDHCERDGDFEQLSWWVSMERSMTPALWEEAQESISAHRSEKASLSDAQFYMEVRRIAALGDNGHSNVSEEPIYEHFGLLPLRLYWFSDGPFIVRATERFRNLLGARIEAVNGTAIGDLTTTLKEFHGGSQDFFRHYSAAPLMLSAPLMHAIGLSESPEELILTVTTLSGEKQEVTVPLDRTSSSIRDWPWRYLNPAPIENENGWATLLETDTALPLYLRQPDEVFRYVLLEKHQVAYIQMRFNMDSNGEAINAFLTQTLENLERDRPHSIILDSRQNPGGDLTLAAEAALKLPQLAKPEGKVYVLTGPGTFSAGIYTSFFPKASDAQRTVVVGEHVGDRPQFWAESGPPFRLRDSQYFIGYSLQMHDLANGCSDPEKCHMAQWPKSWNIAVGTLVPDWPVPSTFADYKTGRDPVMERVLADLR
jgi:hypothetical protein